MLTTAFVSLALLLPLTSNLTPSATTTSDKADATRAGALPAPVAPTQSAKKIPRPIRDLDGKVIGDEGAVETALGGTYYNPFSNRTGAAPYLYGTWEVTLNDTGTTWQEPFIIGIPRQMQTPAPLLVAFHGWGNTHKDIVVNTKYFQKAMARGWWSSLR